MGNRVHDEYSPGFKQAVHGALAVTVVVLVVVCSLLDPVDPSFRALSGRLKITARRHKFNKDSLSRSHREILSHGHTVKILSHGHKFNKMDCVQLVAVGKDGMDPEP